MEDTTVAKCVFCGCSGNMHCNHEPLDKKLGCELHPVTLVCPCCRKDANHMGPKPLDGQIGMF